MRSRWRRLRVWHMSYAPFLTFCSALRNACCTRALKSLADHRQSHRFPDRICHVHRRWFCARRTLWNRVGVLETKTEVIFEFGLVLPVHAAGKCSASWVCSAATASVHGAAADLLAVRHHQGRLAPARRDRGVTPSQENTTMRRILAACVSARLAGTAPAQCSVSVCSGDFRSKNLLITQAKVAA